MLKYAILVGMLGRAGVSMDEIKNNGSMNTGSTEGQIQAPIEQQTLPEGSGTAPTPEKKPNNAIKIIIPIAALIILVVILVGVAFATGKLGRGNGKKEIAEAMAATFTQSGEAMKDAWELDEYKDMFKDKEMCFDAVLTVLEDLDLDLIYNRDDTASSLYVGASFYGSDYIEAVLYADEDEFSFGIPSLIDYAFYVDRTRLEEDIWNLVDEGLMEAETAEGIILLNQGEQELNDTKGGAEQGAQDILNAVKAIYQEAEVKKIDSKTLEVNGEDKNCKGYVVIITPQQIADFLITYKEVYEENEAFQNYFNQIMALEEGYDSVEELLEDIDPADRFQELADEAIEEITEDIELCFYLSDGMIAQILYEEDRDNYFEWNIKGGNFPLENTDITLMIDGYENYISRSGSMKKGVYTADYEIDIDYETFYLDIEYNTGNGDLDIEAYDYYSEWIFSGNIYKSIPGSELEIDIYSLEFDHEEVLYGDIIISNQCGEMERPEGEPFNVLKMTEDDYYNIMGEIIYGLY